MRQNTITRFILFFVIAMSIVHAQEDIPALIQRLDSLPNEENATLYGSLSQETKDAIAAERRKEAVRVSERVAEAEKNKMELLDAGTFPLAEQVVGHYRDLGLKVAEEIADPREKSRLEAHVRKTAQEFANAMGEAPAPLTIRVWEENREKIAAVWESFEWDTADASTLAMVEQAFTPIVREVQKISAAEPEQDKPWWLREKWRHLIVPNETGSEQ